ncbi:MAG TPA: Asp-tRNA(Asn)/Glu-tRNA(Gln) amidotransferase subunit GatC [Gemmatimonadales bacterium]|jgi:aspartyl-tRNA(Asn)/glutamyl-tRNA(Gln) amidotransferase subunit C|nr:Asp-tRNA(Asn)/Glu-tRNA(Gln) amidotransferase subunit GatC [Gemmatimonadales bacterium]
MSVTPKDVQHVARLAELAVEPDELPELTEQMDRIVGFVAQLAELEDRQPGASYLAGPERAPLRPDEVQPADLLRPPATLAPEFVDGFFVVPRLGAMEEP